MTELTYNDEHATRVIDVSMTRDTVKLLPFSHDFTAAEIAEAYLTMRDDDDTVVFTSTLEYYPNQWSITDNYCEFEFDDDDTAGLQADYSYKIGVMFVDINGDNQVPIVGRIRFVDQIVYDDATAGYETWQTRAARDLFLDSIACANRASATAAQALAGASDILLNDASVFVVGDSFTIFDASGSENHDISAISTNTITLGSGGDGATIVSTFAKDSVAIKDF